MNGPYVCAYTRVSTKDQAEEGVSLAAQRERVDAWAKSRGMVVGLVETDAGLSGGRADNRPALQRALDAVCREKGVLVVYSLSRLARSTRDAIDIMERLHGAGADLVSLTENIDTTTAMGKLFFRLMAALAEFERDIISERTSMAMAHKRARGEHCGGQAPYGWRVDGESLGMDADEQRVIGMIRYMAGNGNNPAVIARELNRLHVAARGSVWHAKSVSRILAATRRTA
jgi:DNA invertase Pin-like site-specific DNA recombinase